MNLGDIYLLCNTRLNKDQTGNSFNPTQFNAALKAIDLEYFKKKTGLPEDYAPGQPISRQAWDITQMITQQLSHLKVYMGNGSTQPLYINPMGRATLPVDFMYPSALMYKVVTVNDAQNPGYDYNSVEIMTDAEYVERRQDACVPINKKYPVAFFASGVLQFYPTDLAWAQFIYLRKPTPAYFDFDYVNDELFYLPPGTTRKGETVSVSAATTNGSQVVTLSTTTTTSLVVGSAVTGTDIPASTTLTEIISPTKFKISNAATATGSPTLTINSAGTASRSVELDWPEITHTDIANLLYLIMTENLKDDRGYNQAKQRQVTGE